LDASIRFEDMNLPGFRLHQLSGKDKDICSVTVKRKLENHILFWRWWCLYCRL